MSATLTANTNTSAKLAAYVYSLEVEAIADACARIKVMESSIADVEACVAATGKPDPALDDMHLTLNVTKDLALSKIGKLNKAERAQLLALINA
jgi:hypothetical protein